MTQVEPLFRLLIVDDTPSIHGDFVRILSRSDDGDAELDELASSLLGVTSTRERSPFQLDSAFSGEEALDKLLIALAKDRPYALVFMDIRMPSGWNGVETAVRMFSEDDLVQIILCTAHADYRWGQLIGPLANSDRVLILKKPFDVLEVKQLANAMCTKWQLARRDRRRMNDLEHLVNDKTYALEAANDHLRKEIAERTRAERDLRKAQRLEGLGRLAAGLCHEINNPLSFILSSLEAMEDALDDVAADLPADVSTDIQELIRTANIGADRITRIVRSVKLFARQSDAPTELVDLVETMGLIVELVGKNLDPHIELKLDMEATPMAMGRRLELEQVLTNLVENAAHALADQSDRPARIELGLRRAEQDRVIVTVADTGPGIDDAVVDKIFDPFFTTKPVNQGTGLGLSICHSLINGMNGSIQVETEKGKGTTFLITLRSVPQKRPEATINSPTDNEPQRKTPSPITDEERRGRVLVLDDEPFILRILQRVLRAHDVTPVSNAHDALSLCLSNTYDVIFSDIMMPGMSGEDFYRMLANERPGEEDKIVFITGGTLIEEVLQFLDSVPNTCVEKPVNAQELNTLIETRVAERMDVHQA